MKMWSLKNYWIYVEKMGVEIMKQICATCKHFELRGNAYFQIEHCMLHDTYQKHRNEPLQVCDDWTQSKYAGVKKVIAILNRGMRLKND